VFSKLGNPGKWWVVEKKLVLSTTTHDSRGGHHSQKKSRCLGLWIALKKVKCIALKIVHKRTAEVTADPSMDMHSLAFPLKSISNGAQYVTLRKY
jgi:hypothetical protein